MARVGHLLELHIRKKMKKTTAYYKTTFLLILQNTTYKQMLILQTLRNEHEPPINTTSAFLC